VEEVENIVLGTENKIAELDQSKNNGKYKENMNGTCKTSGTP
jgi:hypothetical protein